MVSKLIDWSFNYTSINDVSLTFWYQIQHKFQGSMPKKHFFTTPPYRNLKVWHYRTIGVLTLDDLQVINDLKEKQKIFFYFSKAVFSSKLLEKYDFPVSVKIPKAKMKNARIQNRLYSECENPKSQNLEILKVYHSYDCTSTC